MSRFLFILFFLNLNIISWNSTVCAQQYKKILSISNIYACRFTDTSRFTLGRSAYVYRMSIWYHWSPSEKAVPFVLYHNGKVFLKGYFLKGNCDRYQRMWCGGEFYPQRVFPRGNYVLKVARRKLCQNARSNHNGFITLWGSYSTTSMSGKEGSFTFWYPRIKGYRLDWCRVWARECGKGAADAFCRLKGYEYAKDWKIDPDIGLRSPTYVIGTGQICNKNFCDGFKYIVCVNTAKHYEYTLTGREVYGVGREAVLKFNVTGNVVEGVMEVRSICSSNIFAAGGKLNFKAYLVSGARAKGSYWGYSIPCGNARPKIHGTIRLKYYNKALLVYLGRVLYKFSIPRNPFW